MFAAYLTSVSILIFMPNITKKPRIYIIDSPRPIAAISLGSSKWPRKMILIASYIL